MIEIRKLTKSFPVKSGRHYVFREASAVFPEGANIGIIGPNGGGKSTFLRILGGIDHPDSGEILTRSTFSWPLGLRGGFVSHMSGRANCRMICHLYGLPQHAISRQLEKIKELSGIGKYFEEPVFTYSSGMGSRVGFALSMSFDFDYFLIDEITAIGDADFKRLAKQALEEKARRSKIIIVSHNLGDIRKFCDIAVVLRDGQMTVFDDVESAIRSYLPQTEENPVDEDEFNRTVDLDSIRLNCAQLPDDLGKSIATTRQLLAEIEEQVTAPGCMIEGPQAPFFSQLGQCLFRLGDLHLAERYFKAAIEEDTWSFTAWQGLMQVAERQGDTDGIERCLTEMEKIDPKHPSIRLTRARLLLEGKRTTEAAELAEALLKRNPRNFGAWHLFSRAKLALGETETALQAQIKAIDGAQNHLGEAPLLAFYHHQLAELLCLLGKQEEAMLARLQSRRYPQPDPRKLHEEVQDSLRKLLARLSG